MKAASDNQSRAYLNGNLIYETTLSREYPMDQDVVAGVTLNAGTNALVFKVVYETGGGQGSVRFTDAAGQPVPGLRTTLTPP